MQAANAGIRTLFWSEIASVYPCKPKILPLLAELFGLFPLAAYNCWQTVKTDALSSFRGVGTANYSTNNHLLISQQFTQHEYLHNMVLNIYAWYTNMADDITCTSYDVSCKGSIATEVIQLPHSQQQACFIIEV